MTSANGLGDADQVDAATPSYDAGGHPMRVAGINAVGAVVLDLGLDVPDKGHSEPDEIFHDATEPPISNPASVSSSEPEAHSVGGSEAKARKHWRVAAAALSLAGAAQLAQKEHAEQDQSDWATSFKRQESDTGHGPFAQVPLEPKEGMHSISILVVGTRGDVQPFLAVALELKTHGHRVRLATHANYRKFVESQGIEFYPLGGDPAVLSEFVVKNRGILPGSVKDVKSQDKQIQKIVWSCYPACTEADPERQARPFKCTCIIANPPSIAHCCVAEALQVPLHMMFTMPWTPTKLFPHPMCVVQSVNVAGVVASGPSEVVSGAANYYSYNAIDMYVFLGFAPELTKLRRHLKLPAWPNPSTAPAHSITNLKIPFTYMWSPSLQPSPADWPAHVAVTGFVFLDEDATNFTPSPELAAFLAPPNEAPIYIGFGSLVLTDPKATTAMIYQASVKSGKRVLLSSGWAKLGVDVPNKPDSVFILGNCPHSWLFPKCSAAIHHGGAGTTAAGLRAALPTLVVPFFGDQPFWGDCCQRAGVGPKPVPIGKLSTTALLNAFETFDRPEVLAKAKEVATEMSTEDGRKAAVEHFHTCMKHRSKIVEPGTYGMSPNVIAKMGTFIGDKARAIGDKYHSVEDSGQKMLENSRDANNKDAPIKVHDAASEDLARGAVAEGGAKATGMDSSPEKGGFFSKLCGCASGRLSNT